MAHNRLPLLFAVCLIILIVVSATTSGLASPVPPQEVANEGHRLLWLDRIEGPGGAVDLFEQALRSDSSFPYRWSDLGDALLAANQTQKARYCFDRALELAPHDPQIGLRAANFHFRTGEAEQALRIGATVLRQTPEFDDMIFSSYIRMGGDLHRVLDTGIGGDARSAREFYRFMLPRDNAPELDTVWNWMETQGFATRPLALARASWLLRKDRPDEAAALWLRFAESPGSGWRTSNWIENPGFESDWTGEGFDWRVESLPSVEVKADDRIAHGGSRSLRIRFDAPNNPDFAHVSQKVWLPPGHYRLSAWVRTDDLSTDQGIGLRITPPNVSTATLVGTHDWTELSCDFTVSDRPLPASVNIVRRPSLKFDNRPRGTVWIDDVRLSREDSVPSRARK